MATDETRDHVAPNVAFEGLTFAPLPVSTTPVAAFALIKLDQEAGGGDDEWCVRTTGAYSRIEFLGALSSYVYALQRDEARGWEVDSDDEP